MGKRKFNAISIGFAVLILLTVALLGANSLRRSSHIVLPTPASSSAGTGISSGPRCTRGRSTFAGTCRSCATSIANSTTGERPFQKISARSAESSTRTTRRYGPHAPCVSSYG